MKKWISAFLMMSMLGMFVGCGCSTTEPNGTDQNNVQDDTMMNGDTVNDGVNENNTNDNKEDNNDLVNDVTNGDNRDDDTMIDDVGEGIKDVGEGIGQGIEDVGEGIGNGVDELENGAADQ